MRASCNILCECIPYSLTGTDDAEFVCEDCARLKFVTENLYKDGWFDRRDDLPDDWCQALKWTLERTEQEV